MGVKVGVNGFGRVGRYIVRACLGYDDIDIVAINSRAKPDILAHLLKYDSVHGKINAEIAVNGDNLLVNDKKIAITHVMSNLSDLPWKELGVDIALESSGRFRNKDELSGHLTAGAKKVILAAPGKGIDGTFVMGVNEDSYDPAKHTIISNASCTTNCLATVAKVLHDEFRIVRGLMTTVHAYTMDQRLLDGSHSDLRRGRAAAMSIVPTSTGAATAVAEVIPDLKGKLGGLALRVPTPNVSVVDLAVEVGRCAGNDAWHAELPEEGGGEDAVLDMVVADGNDDVAHLVDAGVAQGGLAGRVEAVGLVDLGTYLLDKVAVLVNGKHGEVAAGKAEGYFGAIATKSDNCTLKGHD